MLTLASVGSAFVPLNAGAASHTRFHLPNFTYWSRARVNSVMHQDLLYFGTSGPGSSTSSWVSVVAQSPAPGTIVSSFSTVHLTVSMAKAHDPTPMPLLTTLNWAAAHAILNQVGARIHVVLPPARAGHWLKVVGQSPAYMAPLNWHGVVTLRVVSELIPPTTTTSTSTTTTTTPDSTSSTTPGDTTSTTAPGDTTSTTLAVTTTTKKVPTTTWHAANERYGIATWYSYIPGRCANYYSPKGTRLYILDLKTRKVISCLVTDRENSRGDHVVDLSMTQFAQLAPLYVGVVRVKVWWK